MFSATAFFRHSLALCFCISLLASAALFCGSASAADRPTVYIAADGSDSAAGTADAPLASLYGAFRALPDGGRAVVRGRITGRAAVLPASAGLITVCGEDAEAALFMGGNITFQSAVEIENLHIVPTAKNLVFLCGGNYARFGDGLAVTAADGVNLPGITAGAGGTIPADGTYLEICSGAWFRVRGGARGTSSAKTNGPVCVVVHGGSFGSTFDLGGDSMTDGDAFLYIDGGDFGASVNLASAADTTGNVTAVFAGGSFAAPIRASRGGRIGGDLTVRFFCAPAKPFTCSEAAVAGKLTVERPADVSAVVSGTDVRIIDEGEVLRLREEDDARIAALRTSKLPQPRDGFAGRDTSPCGSAVRVQPVAPHGLGDADGDGRLTVADVLRTLRSAAAGEYLAAADADLSGRVTARDAWEICRAIAAGRQSVLNVENELADSLLLFGGAAATDGRIDRGFALGTADQTVYSLYTDAVFGDGGKAGLFFGCDLTDGLAGADGYYFEVGADGGAAVYRVTNGQYREIAARKTELYGAAARLRVTCTGDAAAVFLEGNPLDPSPFPLFDLALPARGSFCGVYAEAATASLPVLYGITPEKSKTYTNTLREQFTDPEVFFADGRYYFYGTQSSTQNSGIKCYSTTDFRIFKDEGFVLTRGNAFGDGVFKAANIVEYDGDYYLFYMAGSEALGTSVTAYATAASPTGPFKNEAMQPLTNERDLIGGQPFVDADGQAYLIYTRTTGANRLCGAKLTLADGKAAIDLATETLLLSPTEPWENAKAPVVECGYILRHGDLYYLLYSGGNYNSAYGTGYATAASPLGPYTKYEKNPILVSNDQAFGVGAATVFPAADGSEHFIAYLRSFSPTVTRPLCTCIDRIKFVPNPDGGADLLSVYGPTVTPQPLPSGLGTASAASRQTLRFIW